jgi:hypothetical protein
LASVRNILANKKDRKRKVCAAFDKNKNKDICVFKKKRFDVKLIIPIVAIEFDQNCPLVKLQLFR